MRHNLSEILEVIEDRRTIFPEQFSERKVHKEIVQKLLDAAKWAPTHKLTQPWNFTVYMGEGLTKFGLWHAETYKAHVDEEKFQQRKYDKIKNRAELSSAIVVAAMKRDQEESIPEIEEIASVAAGIQNMAVLATAYGLGFYWGTGGMTYSDQMRNYIGLDEKDRVMGLIYLGYPKIDWPRKTPRKPQEYFAQFIED